MNIECPILNDKVVESSFAKVFDKLRLTSLIKLSILDYFVSRKDGFANNLSLRAIARQFRNYASTPVL